MNKQKITHFSRYPFEKGEQIYIKDGPRKGDWVVVEVGERKIVLRCPVSGTEVKWDRFCYQVGE